MHDIDALLARHTLRVYPPEFPIDAADRPVQRAAGVVGPTPRSAEEVLAAIRDYLDDDSSVDPPLSEAETRKATADVLRYFADQGAAPDAADRRHDSELSTVEQDVAAYLRCGR